MAASVLQSKVWGASVPSGTATAFTSSVTAGSVLYWAGRYNTTVTSPAVSDGSNGSWTLLGTMINNTGIAYARFYVKNSAAGTITVTATAGGSPGIRAEMLEIGGVDTAAPLDQSAQADGTSTTPSSGATGTRTQAAEIIIGWVGTDGGNTFTAGTGFTLDQANAEIASQPEHQVVSATGTDAATFTLGSSQHWACFADTFKASGGGGGGKTSWGRSSLDGASIEGIKQFNPSLSYHRHPMLSLEGYRREQARKHREFLRKVERAA